MCAKAPQHIQFAFHLGAYYTMYTKDCSDCGSKLQNQVQVKECIIGAGCTLCQRVTLCGCHTVQNHPADLAQLQSVVTQQPERYSTLDTYVVVIDEMRVVNSSKSHRQLRELFQLTRVGKAL